MIKSKTFQPVKTPANRHSIGGILAVAAIAGMVVTRTSGNPDVLELATGKAGFFLRKDVVSKADLKEFLDADALRPNKGGFETPYTIGGAVQADDYLEVWCDADLLDGIDVNTAVDTQVTTAAGKITPLADSEAEECLGIIRRVEPAKNSSEADAARILLEVRRSVLNVPAAT